MNDILDSLFEKQNNSERTTISISMDTGLLKDIDISLKSVGNIKGRFCSRNSFMDVSARKYLSAIKYEMDKLNISPKEEPKNQVIIFTCSEKEGNYDKMFKNKYWSAVSLGKKVVNLINDGVVKYFALYRGVPYRYIDSYAEIIKINKLLNGKYKFELGKIEMLPKPVPVKIIEPSSFMKGRRIMLQKLLDSTVINKIDRI